MVVKFQGEFGDPPVLFGGQDDVQIKLFAQQANDFSKALLRIAAQVRADFHLPTRKINGHDATSSERDTGYGTRDDEVESNSEL